MKIMLFVPGDLVHVAALGKGTVREVRNGERNLAEVKGRSVVVKGDQLTVQSTPRKPFPQEVGSSEVRIINGRSGGRIKAALHIGRRTIRLARLYHQ